MISTALLWTMKCTTLTTKGADDMTREELRIIASTPYLVRMIEEMHARIQMNDPRGIDSLSKELRERVNVLKHIDIDADTPAGERG